MMHHCGAAIVRFQQRICVASRLTGAASSLAAAHAILAPVDRTYIRVVLLEAAIVIALVVFGRLFS
jgi:hypothetical protein